MSNEFDNWEDETIPYFPDPPSPPDNNELSPAQSIADQISAHIANVGRAINADPGASPPPELSKEDPAERPVEAVQVQKCTIDSVLPTSVINLIKVAPQNNTVRAVILAHLNVTIPDECVSYAQIKKWIEFNYVPAALPEWVPPAAAPAATRFAPARPPLPTFSFSFTASESEYGTAQYSVERSGNGLVDLTEQEILEEANESVNWGEFLERINDLVDNNAASNVNWDSIPETAAVDGGYYYTEHEASNDEDFSWNWNRQEVKNGLRILLDRLLPGKTADFDAAI